MERKIGEIFTYGDKRYQVVKVDFGIGCIGCAFKTSGYSKYKSFLGLHNVPIVYGMTCGEYAQMVNGEAWMKNKVKCNLSIIPLKNYDRTKFVSGLPVKPSPNLPIGSTSCGW